MRATLMQRVFAVDVERCPRCGVRETTIRFVTATDEIERVLRSLGYANGPGPERTAAA